MKDSIANSDQIVVVKTVISAKLKLEFRILCVQQGTTMSLLMEQLLNNWLQGNKQADRASSYPQNDLEVVGIYIPAHLKTQLKISCMQQKVSMKMVLSQLIEEWVVANLSTLSTRSPVQSASRTKDFF